MPRILLATDGSNDNGLKKMNPLTVQIHDVNLKRVKTSLLDMCLSSGSTAEMLCNESMSVWPATKSRGKTALHFPWTTLMLTW